MGFFEFFLAFTPVLLSILLPGILAALALLKKAKLGIPEMLGFGFGLGIVLVPLLAFLESLAGIPFSLALLLANAIIISAAGLALAHRQGAFPISLKFDVKRDWVWLALLAIIALAFYIRVQSAFPSNAGLYFYEFDPYYYTQITIELVQHGIIPVFSDNAFYPHQTSYRATPLTNYLGAGWYELYNRGRPFDIYNIEFMQSIYPPIVAAAAVFFIFMLISEPYGKRFGLIAAAIFASAPQLVQKLAAGEQEQTPWGTFGLFFFLAAYALMVNRGDRRFALLAGIALATLTLGSKSDVVAYLIMAGYVGLQGIVNFLRGKLDMEFIKNNAIILAFGFSAQALLVYAFFPASMTCWLYSPAELCTRQPIPAPPATLLSLLFTRPLEALWQMAARIPTDPLALVGALYFAYALHAVQERISKGRGWERHEKVLLFPLYLAGESKIVDFGSDKTTYLIVLLAIGAVALFVTPLGPTVLGYVQAAAANARPDTVVANTVAEETSTGGAFVGAVGPQIGGALAWLFSSGLLTADTAPLVFGALLALAFYYSLRTGSQNALLFVIICLPVIWVGLGKIKFVHQLTYGVVVAFSAILGEAALEARARLRGDLGEKAAWGVFGVGALVAVLMLWPIAKVSAASLNPANQVQGTGYALFYSCDRMIEAAKGDGQAYGITGYLYCSRIPEWWLSPMAWVSRSVAPEDRVIHWWDYGHWTNFFGQRKTITRNDHQEQYLDQQMADLLVDARPPELWAWMGAHKAKYLLLDIDLVGKWGALVYISCVYNNETAFTPGSTGGSACEREHQFERVFVPLQVTNADLCQIQGPNGEPLVRMRGSHREYCAGNVQTQQGQRTIVAFVNGTQNRVVLVPQGQNTLDDGRTYNTFMGIYMPGEPFADRAGRGYDSIFYQGFVLGHIDGMVQVYPEEAEYAQPGLNVPVRIFKLKDNPRESVTPPDWWTGKQTAGQQPPQAENQTPAPTANETGAAIETTNSTNST